MAPFIPSEDFTDRVMVRVRRIHHRQRQQLLLIEKLTNTLPVKALLSFAALLGGIWNLVRIFMILAPTICK